MRRMQASGFPAVILLASLGVAAVAAPDPPARLTEVKTAGAGTLLLAASAPFSYTHYQPHERSLIIDLAGVTSELNPLPAPALDWLASYRLLSFRNAGGQPVLRLDAVLARDCAVSLSQPSPASLALDCGARPQPIPAAAAPATPAPAPAGAPVEVRDVTFHEAANGFFIHVAAPGPLAHEVRLLENPLRLVVDIPHSVLATARRRLEVNRAEVQAVRLGQFKKDPPVTRVVLDMNQKIPYQVSPVADGLDIVLRLDAARRPQQPNAEPAAALASATPSPKPAAPAPAEPAAGGAADPEPALLASLAPSLPAVAKGSAPEPAAALARLQPSVAAAQAAPAGGGQQTAAMPAPGGTVCEPPFSGEPINVNFKDVDAGDFFRLIHEFSGLNIIVDRAVTGTITLVLVDVPWDQAMSIVLKNNNWGCSLEGNVLRIAALTTLKKEQEDLSALAKARREAAEPVTISRSLSYAKASDLEPTLKRFLSGKGEIIKDDRTNTLIIRDIPAVLPQLDDLIGQLDRKSPQVEIEARVVSASRGFLRQFGTQLGLQSTAAGGRSIFGGEGTLVGASPIENTGDDLSLIPPFLVDNALPLITNFPAPAASSGFTFIHRSANFFLDYIITAAESRGIGKLLSKPRIITQDNIEGSVEQGVDIPVQTVVNNTISTQFIPVVLKLQVKPHITIEGTVFLDIAVENRAIAEGIPRINGIPAITTQRANTQVLVADGSTIVVGGVMLTSTSYDVTQVPFLGSIPVLGHLFKRTAINSTTQELLFFITPRILPS